MSNYVGIDLGTTNSAICSFDGQETKIYKSPEQTDVTPSAIFIDKRGNRFVGMRAYNNASKSPGNAATLFKRLIGTSTPIQLPSVGLTMTPEECSTEILRTLFGYLPEHIRNDPDVGTVITVPAAFSQTQKDATIEAARAAGLGKVALMQEPVAAVMSVVRAHRGDGIFLIYDLGGGTLDIAIAQSANGRVSLLGQGGIAMCGGRDFDRRIVDAVVTPWLKAKFDLPEDFAIDPRYRSLRGVAYHAAEKAKIELSSCDEAVISADERDINALDLAGNEIYIDVALTSEQFASLVEDKVLESINAARDTIVRAGLGPHDIERVVFVGGPTQNKALRTRVAFELGVATSTDVNPMTAVAMGASIFAEAIDWTTHNRTRKTARGTVSAGSSFKLTINHVSRTPEDKAKVALKLGQPALPGSEYQIDCVDTGWTSGRRPLRDGDIASVPLSRAGENVFKLFVFDPSGGPIALAADRVVIAKVAGTVDAIPASHSIGVEALDRVGGSSRMVYLVRAGDQLPAKGEQHFRAEETLLAGSDNSLKFKLWEGDIERPISNNAFIGLFEIKGSDLTQDAILAGADLIMKYEVMDSGALSINVEIPSISSSWPNRNFYSRRSAEVDYTRSASRIRMEAESIERQIVDLSTKLDSQDLRAAQERIAGATSINIAETDPEAAKQAADHLQEAKRLLAGAKKANLSLIRRYELDLVVQIFNESVRKLAKPAEVASFDKLHESAETLMNRPSSDFEARVQEMHNKAFAILARQDWFVVDRFNHYDREWSDLFSDRGVYDSLIAQGRKAMAEGQVEQLREVVASLDRNRVRPADADDLVSAVNIIAA